MIDQIKIFSFVLIIVQGNPLIPTAPHEITLSLSYTWPQEPHGYVRTAKVAIPETQPGEKVPVVFHLHGNGGQGNTHPFGNFLGDACIIVAPDGYERSWNIYFEKSKADDVQFILDLIKKIEEEIPQADMTNMNIAGEQIFLLDKLTDLLFRNE